MTPIRVTLCLLIALVMLAVWSYFSEAWGQQLGMQCVNSREKTVRILYQRYEEVCTRRGFTSRNILVEVFENMEAGTFTILYTYPSTGKTCYGAAGREWVNPVDTLEASR